MTQILCINKKSGVRLWIPFDLAVSLWTFERIVDIARDAPIRDYPDDEDLFIKQKIIKGIWSVFGENPKTVYYEIYKKPLDELETVILEQAKELLQIEPERKMKSDVLIACLHGLHPTSKEDTIRRRLDSLVEHGHLAKQKEGVKIYYTLVAFDKVLIQ